jgi:hypothetical protein
VLIPFHYEWGHYLTDKEDGAVGTHFHQLQHAQFIHIEMSSIHIPDYALIYGRPIDGTDKDSQEQALHKLIEYLHNEVQRTRQECDLEEKRCRRKKQGTFKSFEQST